MSPFGRLGWRGGWDGVPDSGETWESQVQSSLTLFEKIWRRHVIKELGGDRAIIHIDRHLVHEGTSAAAFAALKKLQMRVHRRDLTYAVIDHGVSTLPGRTATSYGPTSARNLVMQRNCLETGIELIDVNDPHQGIVHVIAHELGIALPGTTLVCGDSHTATSGGLGVWAWGIGSTEVQQTLGAQALIQRKPKTMQVNFEGTIQRGVSPKDVVMYMIGKYGVAAGTGFVIEYAGSMIRALTIEGRCTICNMSIEFGARGGLIAADDTTYDYLYGRMHTPKGAMWDAALADWRTLNDCTYAQFDKVLEIDCNAIGPQITWGNSPQDVISIDESVPNPDRISDPAGRASAERAIAYMDIRPGATLDGTPIDYAFIGSCTNSRLSDIAAAAEVARGRKVAPGVQALVVPGSLQVKAEAEALGLDKILIEAGFEWRNSGCSMCVATNGDVVRAGARCISTSNRNFEGRQGPQSRTHLSSPAMVAAAAVNGRITDVRKLI